MANKRKRPKLSKHLKNWLSGVGHFIWSGSARRKTLIFILGSVIIWTAAMYGVARWYIAKHADERLVIGTTFVSDYAESFGLKPEEALRAVFEDLGIKQIRLVSYWEDIEPTPGIYDFSGLDWQFEMAREYNAKVSLAIGLRQPRWPECHEPKWVDISEPETMWKSQLYRYISAVVNRYKDSPVLDNYQLENEFFMTVFGECKNFDRKRLVEEFKLVKKLDPARNVIISRSNNWVGIPVGAPTPDKFGISVYKRVWDATVTKRYFEYPLPAWFYATLAGWGEIFTGKDMMIHELQAEPWPPGDIHDASLAEQYKSMNANRMQHRIQYGVATGMREINLWGVEWWYWLMTEKGDASVWNVVKDAVKQANLENQKLLIEN